MDDFGFKFAARTKRAFGQPTLTLNQISSLVASIKSNLEQQFDLLAWLTTSFNSTVKAS